MFEFDPFDPTYFADPYPYYREMRGSTPCTGVRYPTTASGRIIGC